MPTQPLYNLVQIYNENWQNEPKFLQGKQWLGGLAALAVLAYATLMQFRLSGGRTLSAVLPFSVTIQPKSMFLERDRETTASFGRPTRSCARQALILPTAELDRRYKP